MIKNTLWVEKYRPSVVQDCVLPKDIKTVIQSIVNKRDIPNLLLSGRPGIGKTTIAKALCNELGCDVMIINGSDESGIDVLRNKIKTFASTISMYGDNVKKVVIIDEADYLNAQSTQPALRNFMEEYSANCRFILTANFKKKIIDPLLSRLSIIEFQIPIKEKQDIIKQIYNRLIYILNTENIEYDKKIVANVIIKYYPDFRKTLLEIQKYCGATRKLDVGILSNFSDTNLDELMKALKEKNFTAMRKWVTENLDSDPSYIVRKVFDNLESNLEKSSIPQAILILADYQHKSAFVADQEIHMTAMFIELMAECVFV